MILTFIFLDRTQQQEQQQQQQQQNNDGNKEKRYLHKHKDGDIGVCSIAVLKNSEIFISKYGIVEFFEPAWCGFWTVLEIILKILQSFLSLSQFPNET